MPHHEPTDQIQKSQRKVGIFIHPYNGAAIRGVHLTRQNLATLAKGLTLSGLHLKPE